MIDTEKLQQVLDELNTLLGTHGGGIELVKVDNENDKISIRLTGACKGCPLAQMTFEGIIRQAVIQKLPEVKEIELV